MSGWLWSTPPSDEPVDTPTTEGLSVDPYGTPSSTDYQQVDSFGTAFGDDLPTETKNTETSFDTTQSSFDLYSSTAPSSNAFPFPDPSSSSNESNPTIDFGSMGRINPNVLSPRSGTSVDYVFTDDYQEIRRKGPGEQLTCLAGTSYLLGGSIGGLAGLRTALKESAGKPTRLRINAILNGTGKRGAMLANACGVCALAFSISESLIYNYTSDETLPNYAAAGAITGALFKSTKGPRAAAIWAVGGAAVALGTVYASRQGMYGRGLQGVL